MTWKNYKGKITKFKNSFGICKTNEDKSLVIFGGATSDNNSITIKNNNLSIYDVETNQIEQVKSVKSGFFEKSSKPPEARSGHTLTSFKEKIILFGGLSQEKQFLNDTWLLENEQKNPKFQKQKIHAYFYFHQFQKFLAFLAKEEHIRLPTQPVAASLHLESLLQLPFQQFHF